MSPMTTNPPPPPPRSGSSTGSSARVRWGKKIILRQKNNFASKKFILGKVKFILFWVKQN
jgi:hypothetical protein